MRKILGCIKRAQNEFNMIEEGDFVAVGLSGGKDSMTLLYGLSLFRRFAPVNFRLCGITVDMGFEGFDVDRIRDFCENTCGVEFIHEKTQLGHLIFEERKEQNPCGMCSRMRRGILNRVCDHHKVDKLALGHHGDDLVETFLMSLVYESRLGTFDPVTEFERREVVQIRPMVYAEETDVRAAAERHNIPVVKNPCPADGQTSRQVVKELVEEITARTGQPRTHMINALCKGISEGRL